MDSFHSLQEFSMDSCNLTSIPSNITWHSSVHSISFTNTPIETIEANAFTLAHGLRSLDILGAADSLTIEENGLHTTSHHAKILSADNITHFEKMAFGDADSSVLWTTLDISAQEFPENVFRAMLKAHFDMHHTSKWYFSLAYPDPGEIIC